MNAAPESLLASASADACPRCHSGQTKPDYCISSKSGVWVAHCLTCGTAFTTTLRRRGSSRLRRLRRRLSDA